MAQRFHRAIVFAQPRMDAAQQHVGGGIELVDRHRLARPRLGAPQRARGIGRPAEMDGDQVGTAEAHVSRRIVGVELDGTLEGNARIGGGRARQPRQQMAPAQHEIVGLEAGGRPRHQPRLLAVGHAHGERARDVAHDVVAHDDQLVGVGVVLVGPHQGARLRIGEPHGQPSLPPLCRTLPSAK